MSAPRTPQEVAASLPPLTNTQISRIAALLGPVTVPPPPPTIAAVRTCERCGAPVPRDNKRFCSDACYCGVRRRSLPLSPEEVALRAGMTEAQVMRRAHAELEAWIAAHPERTEASA
ncbi:hypothetical protein AAIB33_02180 [Microbacterium sp. AZCO]|uniref:hypothetical protein n=1 Tax=Microbacterium sp. AZCO TaxID=3142976 RepID=UPI0031F41935